jgi:D-alanine-D-alanine ligase
MSRRHVAVLMGGVSSEHEVSVASGNGVLENLDRDSYDVTPVLISKDGLWSFPDVSLMEIWDAIPELKRRRVDCAFLALHGAYGEDGRIQGMLDLLGIPYTSSGCSANGIAIDKIRSKIIVSAAGVPVATSFTVTRTEWEAGPGEIVRRVAEQVGFPCVAKSPRQGSSVGMVIAESDALLSDAMPGLFNYDDIVMIEAFVRGVEVTCGVLDITRPVALPVTEIRPVTSSFFDYHAKYTPGASKEITPAEIAQDLAASVQTLAVKVHEVIGCSIWSRSDFIIGEDGPIWLEVNTVPGMTKTSLFPQAAAAHGITYKQLVGLFVEAAMEKFEKAKKG